MSDIASKLSSTASAITHSVTPNQSEQLQRYYEDQAKLAEIFSFGEAVALSAYIGALSLFGMAANLFTFLVILKTPKLHKSAFYIFLMSLCVSDFLSSLVSPLILYRVTWGFYQWILPHFLCKLGIAVDFWTSCATIQHVLLFTLLRLISVRFPHKFRMITSRHAKIAVVVIWIETFAVGFVIYYLWPQVFPPGKRTFNGDIQKACTASSDWIGMLSEFVKIGFPIVTYIPMGAVVIVATVVCLLLAKRIVRRDKDVRKGAARKSSRKEKHALMQLVLIIASFMLGYIPDLTYKVIAATLRNSGESMQASFEWKFFVTAYCLLRLSECLNPIFYNLGSSNMRNATKHYVCRTERQVDSAKEKNRSFS